MKTSLTKSRCVASLIWLQVASNIQLDKLADEVLPWLRADAPASLISMDIKFSIRLAKLAE